MIAFDFEIGQDDDLVIKSGDFVISESDETHVENILKSAKSEWKEWVLLGVHIQKDINMPTTETLVTEKKKEIKIQLEYDNYRVDKVDLNDFENIIINCERIS